MKKFFSVFFIMTIFSYSVGGDANNLAVADPLLSDCCELPGDGNDDGIVDIYDYLFILGWGYGKSFPPGDVNYPGPGVETLPNTICCDQVIALNSCNQGTHSPSGYGQVAQHLMGTKDPVCGYSHY